MAMEQKGLRSGHFVALIGALAALVSLWRPWYEVAIPQQLRDALSGRLAQDPGLLGQMARGIASALPATISASGWKELQGADAALAVGTVLVIALVLGAGGVFGAAVRIDGAAAARGIAAAGAAGVVLVLVHAVHRPGPHEVVHLAQGLWIALAGCAAILAGGLWAAIDGAVAAPARPATATPTSPAAPLEPEPAPGLTPVFVTSPAAAAASVPPPGA